MESNNSNQNKSQPPNSEPPNQKRVYCQLGILESRADFAERMFHAMKDAGILNNPQAESQEKTGAHESGEKH